MEPGGRFADVAEFGHGDEVAQMTKFHDAVIPERHGWGSIKVLGGAQGRGYW